MSTARETNDLQGLVAQGSEHLERLREVLSSGEPPDVGSLKHAIAVTRAVRGSASLLDLDALQSFLGRLFQLLEDVESGGTSWSARLAAALRAAEQAEADFLGAIEAGVPNPNVEPLLDAEARLSLWRRGGAAAPEVASRDSSVRDASQSAASGGLHLEVEAMVQQVQRLRLAFEAQTLPGAVPASSLQQLGAEISLLQQLLSASQRDGAPGPERPQEGLRNHCEGALRHLMEAAAQEVLDDARERGLCLALRVAGHLDPVDEGLGAALLEVLCNLWSDCLEVQATRGLAEIDTMLRDEDQRLVVEVCDPLAGAGWQAQSEDDVLGRYPGLRRSRPLVESLHGLVWVEPARVPGCRFRLSLPLSTQALHATIVRVGRHDMALAPSAIDGVYAARALRTGHDEAGPFAEVDGMRVPILPLAFVLGDVGFDELLREHVVVVGSFERRAALFTSGPRRAACGPLQGEPQGLWAGSVDTDIGRFPLLHVGALLGRCAPAEQAVQRNARAETAARRVEPTILVVDSAETEREALRGLLSEVSGKLVLAQSADEAWKVLQRQPVDLLVCDLRLPEMNAQQVAERRRMTGEHGKVPMLLVLSHAGEQSHLVMQQLGARAWVRTPMQRDEVLAAVRRLTE